MTAPGDVDPRAAGPAPDDVPAVAAVLPVTTYTDAFTRSLLRHAAADPRIVAITAAMPGPTGLLPFEARFPDRFVDVGIAEQHAVTAAAGMAMAGLRPVVAVYSTFFSRAFDQANLDVGLHRLPVVLVLDRAGITGDDGPSHHGVLDMALGLSIPGMTVFAPSSAQEVEVMLAEALTLAGPSMIRFPKTPAPWVAPGTRSRWARGSKPARSGPGTARSACWRWASWSQRPRRPPGQLADEGVDATVWDVRVVSDPDPAMLADALRHDVVVTAEDGVRQGGAGMFLADALRASCPQGVAPPVLTLGIPRAYLPQDKPDRILARLGLDADGLARTVRGALGSVLPAGGRRAGGPGRNSPTGHPDGPGLGRLTPFRRPRDAPATGSGPSRPPPPQVFAA